MPFRQAVISGACPCSSTSLVSETSSPSWASTCCPRLATKTSSFSSTCSLFSISSAPHHLFPVFSLLSIVHRFPARSMWNKYDEMFRVWAVSQTRLQLFWILRVGDRANYCSHRTVISNWRLSVRCLQQPVYLCIHYYDVIAVMSL